MRFHRPLILYMIRNCRVQLPVAWVRNEGGQITWLSCARAVTMAAFVAKCNVDVMQRTGHCASLWALPSASMIKLIKEAAR